MKNTIKIFIIATLIGICFLITIYFHVLHGVGSVFTHFFYLPILLAALWWKNKGVIVSVILSIFVLLSHFLLRGNIETNNDLFRIIFFIIVSYTIAVLSERVTKAAMETKVSEERFREIFNNMSSGVAVYEAIDEADDFMLKDFNKASERIERISKNDIIDKKVTDIFPEVKEFGLFDVLKRVWQTGKPEQHPIAHYKDNRIDGWRENYVSKLSSGEIVAIYNDVTKLKQAEEERKKLEVQFVQAQKMESIGRLAGGIAHDFNNLLTVIMGNADIALMSISTGDPLYDEIYSIRQSSERAANLTRQLLAFSRRQIIKPRIINMNDLLLDMDKMLRRLIGEDLEFVILTADNLWPVNVDPSQFENVMINLVVNSRDAMLGIGKLTIETANVTLDEEYTHCHISTKAGDYIVISVSDTGKGMDKETMSHIFEPFFTTKETGKGTGLGLSTCYGIIKQNNGNIWVYSEPKHGTTFKIYLPRSYGDCEKTSVIQKKGRLPGGTETIFIVEDEPSVREMVSHILGKKGYNILKAANGEEALCIANKHDINNIHLLLTDVVMPLMGGKELADQLVMKYPGMKTLFMSGYTDNSIVNHGVLEPGLAFMEKPFTHATILQKVREVLDG